MVCAAEYGMAFVTATHYLKSDDGRVVLVEVQVPAHAAGETSKDAMSHFSYRICGCTDAYEWTPIARARAS